MKSILGDNDEKFTCFCCSKTYEKDFRTGWNDEKALEECLKDPDLDESPLVVICDDCFKHLKRLKKNAL